MALGLSCFGLGSVLLVRLGALQSLSLSLFLANLSSANGADAFFDSVGVDKLADDFLRLLIYSLALQSAVDESSGLPPVERQKLLRIALDLLFGNFKNRFGEFGLVFLVDRPQKKIIRTSNTTWHC